MGGDLHSQLPDPKRFYNPRRDLKDAASMQSSTGKVIPELKFMFWQEMFTHRHDRRLWDAHLKNVFPAHDSAESVVTLRRSIFADLEAARRLRNRIAHHEPIFTRNLQEDLDRIVGLAELRSPLVASWMVANQDAARLIAGSPVFKGGTMWTPRDDELASL